MRIGILTHPQAINYGGILQCYALSTYLGKMGHETVVLRREVDTPYWKYLFSKVATKIGLRKIYHRHYIDRSVNMSPFSIRYLNRTKPILSHKSMNKVCCKENLEAVIVGSDQVWRADYALNYGYEYFLDFVPSRVRKLSYAASFGLSTWGYSPEQTKRIKELLANFNGISVREEDAISLCKTHLGLEVTQMPDPTLLLTASDYDKFASTRIVDGKYVFIYWLGDKSLVKDSMDKYETSGYKVVYVGLREQRLMPSIENWLSYIKYADFVLTDSFHGCVFSIIYHRPLVVFENKSGGYGRIMSLLQSIGANKERLMSLKEVDYTMIEKRLKTIREKVRLFFQNSLT